MENACITVEERPFQGRVSDSNHAGFSPGGFFRWPKSYCSGVTLPSQLAIAVTPDRTTASPNEQKYRVPVWFGTVGAAMIW